MSNGKSTSFESTGTLRVTSRLYLLYRGDHRRTVGFVPDADHTVYHGGKKYAVFVSTDPSGNASKSREAHMISFDKDNTVSLHLSITHLAEAASRNAVSGDTGVAAAYVSTAIFTQTVVEATLRQSSVDVEVRIYSRGSPELIALTAPAATHRP